MNEMMTYETRKIDICDVDYMGDYQICHLFNRFAEIATSNAIKLGMWKREMIDHYGWVVAKQTLHLDEPIHIEDTIELSTIVQKGSFVSFPRYYFIKKDGKEIGHCCAIWTLIDIEKRRIIAPKRIGIQIPDVEHDYILEEPQQIDSTIPLHYVMTRKVMYSDVDTNQHMNNTRYIQWALDIIDFHKHKNYFISDLTIHYKKEIQPLTDVELYLGQDQDRYIVEGRSQEEDVYFSIEIVFLKR